MVYDKKCDRIHFSIKLYHKLTDLYMLIYKNLMIARQRHGNYQIFLKHISIGYCVLYIIVGPKMRLLLSIIKISSKNN